MTPLRALGCLTVAALVVTGLSTPTTGQAPTALPTLAHSLLHAHNCYPDDGRWADRIDRALSTGLRPLAIEQDLAWAPTRSGGTSVVTHSATVSGSEPTLEEHFFARVAPLMEQALREGHADEWPVLILHLDFKSNEPEHHRAVWQLLGRYQSWITTAVRPADPLTVTPLSLRPLLVLTENGAGQTDTFYNDVAVGDRLRLFGTVASTDAVPVPAPDSAAAWPRAYRRWVNLPWRAAEGESQQTATAWNDTKAGRLAALVDATHRPGWWLRFYALDGFESPRNGWSDSYNFGSRAAVQTRWRAAFAAGVDLVATDQYEEFASELPDTAAR